MTDNFKNLPIKTKIAYITAIVSLCLGWFLVIVNFFYPPLGDVSDATLWILAQTFLYIGAVVGISTYTKESVEDIKKQIGIK